MKTDVQTFASKDRSPCGPAALPSALGVVVLSFLLLQLIPGDVVDVMTGLAGGGSEETNALMRRELGLDRSLPEQLLNYLAHLVQGDLGMSHRYGVPVAKLIWERLPSSVLLASSALLLAVVSGSALGKLMALNQGRWPDRLLSLVTQVFHSVPPFWVALTLVVIFSVKLGWLPSNGYGTVGLRGGAWVTLIDRVRYTLLPTASLALFYIAVYSRLTRVAVSKQRSRTTFAPRAQRALSDA